MHSPPRQGPPTLGTAHWTIHYAQAYPQEHESVTLARDRFREAARAGGLDSELRENAELCLTELATNAVRHAHDPRLVPQFLVRAAVLLVQRRPCLEVSVWDVDWRRTPPLPDPAKAAEALYDMPVDAVGGRGLLLVASLAEAIGYDRLMRNGKRMWCRWAL